MAQPTATNVINAISEAAGIPAATINPETTLSDLGMTSILAVQLASKLGKELGVEFNLNEMANTETVGDLVSYVESKKI